MPASEPRPVATSDPQATPSQAASTGLAPSSSPVIIPALKPSPQPVVSTTSTAIAGSAHRLGAARPGHQAAVRAERDRHAAGAQPQHRINSRNEVA